MKLEGVFFRIHLEQQRIEPVSFTLATIEIGPVDIFIRKYVHKKSQTLSFSGTNRTNVVVVVEVVPVDVAVVEIDVPRRPRRTVIPSLHPLEIGSPVTNRLL